MSNPLVHLLARPRTRRQRSRELAMASPAGIVEQRFVPIGGIEQWISIRGDDRANPVLVILHGGPASPYSVFIPMLRPWEQHFTIVQWDQRGAGKTLRRNQNNGLAELSLERLAEDAIELIEFLRGRLGQSRVILLASSAGSLIGALVARRRPDLLHAYVGTDQNCPQAREASYRLAREWLGAAGKRKAVAAVEALWSDYPRWTARDFKQFNQWLLKASVARGLPNFALDLIVPAMLSSPNHTLSELGDINTGMNASLDRLIDDLLSFDLRDLGLAFDLPFFIFQGDSDIFTPASAARAYFDSIQAPHKEFALIKDSGHLAAMSRPDQFLQELLSRVRPLALPSEAQSRLAA
jgi:pimeloyl-ACP methyl ester carboxylesterase